MATTTSSLPSFLQPLPERNNDEKDAIECVFTHSEKLGNSRSHCLWWPPSSQAPVETVILFIPGNPGLVGFYEPFLDHIYSKSRAGTAILAHAELGHSPHVECPSLVFTGLEPQVLAVIEVIDEIRAFCGEEVKLLVIGHSIGTWLTMRALKERSAAVTGAFLLFPTITNIVKTPNGRLLWWIFRRPFPRTFGILGNALSRFLIPRRLLSIIFSDWPRTQVNVLHDLVVSGPNITASLSMANDEMHMIRELDIATLNENKQKIWMFLADRDDWVGEENKRVIVQAMADEPENIRVVHGRNGIPHAYCINHSDELADQCLEWMEDRHFTA
ncbi:alpha/beta-hydrolase [Schizopora paradoxa]|uniref:Alpha/beta-hydrolase n=1 Tax=Schizopora paradoxa TaxID=27342 RepID=A0A0H2S913_9AGAM|nr:alpha/beta-hydrolase [Schizopora paradoxa]